MNSPLLIIVSGLPATGKTTISKELAKEFSLPLIGKDIIKESLFDSLGVKDRAWSKELGKASYPILYSFIKAQLNANKSLLVESNFSNQFDTPILKDFISKYDARVLTIYCECDGSVLFERFKTRSLSGKRHPGHQDHLNFDEFKDSLSKGKIEKLELDCKSLTVNTTNIDDLDLTEVKVEIKSLLS
ncbi:AAA family ATPase [Halobacteriovorax sp. RT-2-4]|uniref:AAA family ATPase n=1 Tax=unclassified Halobacteriovorax TaxID=2639665 RepID=UPI00399BAC8A